MIQLRLANEARCEANIPLEQPLYGSRVVVNDCGNHSVHPGPVLVRQALSPPIAKLTNDEERAKDGRIGTLG